MGGPCGPARVASSGLASDVGGRRPEQCVPRVVDPLAATDLAVAVGVLASEHLCDASNGHTRTHTKSAATHMEAWSSLALMFEWGQGATTEACVVRRARFMCFSRKRFLISPPGTFGHTGHASGDQRDKSRERVVVG